MTNLSSLTTAQLRRCAEIKEQIETLEVELAGMVEDRVPPSHEGHGRRTMSAAARARIASAQKARWAKVKGAKNEESSKKRRRMSVAGRAKMAASARARWAKAKAAGKNSL